MKSGRAQPLHPAHHVDPCPSIVPVPLISTSLTPEPRMKGTPLPPPGQLAFGNICNIAPLSTCRLMLLDITIGPLRYVLRVPSAGISTVPPPAAAAALIVL